MIRRTSHLCFVAILCVAPSAFSAGRSALPAPSANSVGVILDDLTETTHAGQLGSATLSSTELLSGSVGSHLINLATGGGRGTAPPRRVAVPEPKGMITWAIDLAGLAGLVLYLRRRTAAPVAI